MTSTTAVLDGIQTLPIGWIAVSLAGLAFFSIIIGFILQTDKVKRWLNED